eukprot:6656067-Prymnesium_polylepis.1
MRENGLHFIGDVKTGTNRFVPKDVLNAATARDNGAWATFTSELVLGGDTTVPIYAVSHRRGESIHGLVATCGTALSGSSHYAYFEDDEERAMGEIQEFELARSCPKVLNDFTIAQQTIDRNNRYRQHILAMEKRLVTNNFSFRFSTSRFGVLQSWETELQRGYTACEALATSTTRSPSSRSTRRRRARARRRRAPAARAAVTATTTTSCRSPRSRATRARPARSSGATGATARRHGSARRARAAPSRSSPSARR